MKQTIFFICFVVYGLTTSVLYAQSDNSVQSERNNTTEHILSGKLNYPPSPQVDYSYNEDGLAKERIFELPKPGVHPRILFSEEEIPLIVERLKSSKVGQTSKKIMDDRLAKGFLNEESWTSQVVQALIDRNFEEYERLQLKENKKPAGKEGYHRLAPLYDCELAALDALLYNKPEQGKRAAAAIAGWAIYLQPTVKEWRKSEFPDNASRWGSWHHCGSLGLFAWEQLGYAYDFAFNFMTKKDQNKTREVISEITNGAYVFGMDLPPHLRAWNWMNVGNCFNLLSLAIEGEKGYDSRVYHRSVDMFRDYITYNYSKKGSSTEAAGYSSFGWQWGAPAIVAMASRNDKLLTLDRYKAIKNWHFHISLPDGSGYLSHGDGGVRGPGMTEMVVMKYFYPDDEIINYNYSLVHKNYIQKSSDGEDGFSIPVLIWGTDPSSTENPYFDGKEHPLTWYDEERGNLITRTEWSKDAFVLNYESRTDSYYAGHEHADRGNFNLMANGILWVPESSFRSVESKYHNVVTIDGRGQGYFPPPAEVISVEESKDAVFISSNVKLAYDWFWPKAIVGVDPDHPKFKIERFAHFHKQAIDFQSKYKFEKAQHPNVVSRFEGFDLGDSGMWDEDPWTIRSEFNSVKKAFRTAGMVKGKHPYALIVDDIQKDDNEHLYEWNLMLSLDVVPISIKMYDAPHTIGPRTKPVPDNIYTDIILGSENIERKGNQYIPQKGEPLLLVRVLDVANPAGLTTYDTKPMPRIEVFEKKDLFAGPGGRTFGMDKKLVIPSRSVSPNFKIMIYPYLHGIDPFPETEFGDKKVLTVRIGEQKSSFEFTKDEDGRTTFSIEHNTIVLINK